MSADQRFFFREVSIRAPFAFYIGWIAPSYWRNGDVVGALWVYAVSGSVIYVLGEFLRSVDEIISS